MRAKLRGREKRRGGADPEPSSVAPSITIDNAPQRRSPRNPCQSTSFPVISLLLGCPLLSWKLDPLGAIMPRKHETKYQEDTSLVQPTVLCHRRALEPYLAASNSEESLRPLGICFRGLAPPPPCLQKEALCGEEERRGEEKEGRRRRGGRGG
uniref:Uncharacterized protein n=1 Tax=Oryza punctata TaxID=4537 RepID=A0A0E0LEJ8_ORYPU